jgi:hypothetical protein
MCIIEIEIRVALGKCADYFSHKMSLQNRHVFITIPFGKHNLTPYIHSVSGDIYYTPFVDRFKYIGNIHLALAR